LPIDAALDSCLPTSSYEGLTLYVVAHTARIEVSKDSSCMSSASQRFGQAPHAVTVPTHSCNTDVCSAHAAEGIRVGGVSDWGSWQLLQEDAAE
jgi:hypothetical protein